MRFEHTEGEAYEDAGGGRVLHSARGFPGFPPRLSIELFERARALTGRDRVGLWDPMCGAGGIVAAVALLRPAELTRVLASDIDDAALELAAKNLSLLSTAGLRRRRAELADRGVDGERLASVDRLLATPGRSDALPATTARADATDPAALTGLDLDGIQVVISDLPYGKQTDWTTATDGGEQTDGGVHAPTPAAAALDALSQALAPGAVIVFSTTERDHLRPLPPATRSFKHGHRHIRMYRVD